MRFIDKVLQEPSYGWCDERGALVIPSVKQLYTEAFSRINIFKTKKNWISLLSWLVTALMAPFLLCFIFNYFSFSLLALSAVYGMVIMGTHATVWYHRYCTHKAYEFSHPLWKFIIQNLVIRTFPEELYVVSHHVHHAKADKPGDPYNSKGGLMYCMLADVNHQSISKNLTKEEYTKAANFLKHTTIGINSYPKYLQWGSISSPFYTAGLWLLNWLVWYSILYIIDGHRLSCALFSGAMCWAILVRAFNYTGHGNGKAKQVDGIDFDRRNLSINQIRPGLLCGEWHNNHHLYPRSARTGFLPFQLDISWVFISMLYRLGAVSSYRDDKQDFLKKYYQNTRAVAQNECKKTIKAIDQEL
jgi:stearoyl-CoA desaturase (delta-9 desaturase)